MEAIQQFEQTHKRNIVMSTEYSFGDVWDVLMRPNYIGAALAIVFMQYRSTILDIIYTAWEDGMLQTFLNLVLSAADIVRGCYHVSRENIRNLSQTFFFSFGDGIDDGHYARHPPQQKETSDSQSHCNVSSHSGNPKRLSSFGAPPPLVMVKYSTKNSQDEQRVSTIDVTDHVATAITPKCNYMDPLEPAFLNKNDYPEGWLVFHPILGVSSVKEANEFDEQQQLSVPHEEKEHIEATNVRLNPQVAVRGMDVALVETKEIDDS